MATYAVGDVVVIRRQVWKNALQEDVADPQKRMFRIDLIGSEKSLLSTNDRQYFGVWLIDNCKGVIYESWIAKTETKKVMEAI